MTRVLVTGAAGDIGGAILPVLAGEGADIVALDRVPFTSRYAARVIVGDLNDRKVVLDALDGVDRVVHMGAIPSPRSLPDDEVFSSNARSSYLLLDEAGRLGVQRAVVASSAAAIGIAWAYDELVPSYVPIDEDHPFVVEDPYGLSKQVTEAIAAMATRRWGIDTLLMRFPFVGSGERLEKHLASFAADPLGSRREVWGWLHRDDAVRAVSMALSAEWTGHHVVNVAAPDTGVEIPTQELLERYLPDVPVRRPIAGWSSLYDSTRAKELFGFEAERTWR